MKSAISGTVAEKPSGPAGAGLARPSMVVKPVGATAGLVR